MVKSRKKWPRTVEQAVNQILLSISDEDKETVKNTPEEDLIIFHHGWGTNIRNNIGLWSGNEELLKSCGAEWMGADSASAIIIQAVWKKLQEMSLVM
jgi:hypothetical protein